MLWSKKSLAGKFGSRDETSRAVRRFGITARLSQLAYKQAKEIVKNQRKKSKRKQRMPGFRKFVATLDYRFFALSSFNGKHFDWAVKFGSGVPNVVVPFGNTRHTLKFINSGWEFDNAIRLGIIRKGKTRRLFIDLIFEKEKPLEKTEGKVIGIDTGYRALLATSEGRLIGTELKGKIEKAGKRRKRFHRYIATEIDRLVKQIELSNVRLICVENLKKVKHNKRGTFYFDTQFFI